MKYKIHLWILEGKRADTEKYFCENLKKIINQDRKTNKIGNIYIKLFSSPKNYKKIKHEMNIINANCEKNSKNLMFLFYDEDKKIGMNEKKIKNI